MKKITQISLKYFLPVLILGFIASGAYWVNSAERPLALVLKFKPSVNVENVAKTMKIEERGTELYNGDTLRTDQNGFAVVKFMDNSIAKVRPDSRLIVRGEVESKQNTSTRIGLELGEVLMNVTEQGTNNFEVATNTSVASVKGTEFGATADDYFWVKEGEVEVMVNRTGQTVTLQDSSYAQVTDQGDIESGDLNEEEVQQQEDEYDQLEEKTEPETIRLRFVDSNGQVQVIEVKVFENQN